MNRRRSPASVAANPTLIGAATVLVVVVAVFLAYNANNGLPFVPTRQLEVDAPNAANLVKGNEVREGGFRIGVLDDIAPTRLRDGRIGARLTLKLDAAEGAVPIDSRVAIRPRSALGLKYVELTRGTAKRTVADGGRLPAPRTEIPVPLEDVLSTFDARTRRNSQKVLVGFGDALAGRGQDLNLTVSELPGLFSHLEPVAANLSSTATDLPGFFRATERTARALVPVSRTQARLFSDLATTFGAFARDSGKLKATISQGPPTLRVGTRALRAQRPFLRDLVAFSGDLNAASRELRASLPDINGALEAGPPVLRRSVTLSAQTGRTLRSLQALSEAGGTRSGLRALTETVDSLNPQLRFLGPYQTVCNGWNYFWTFVAEHLSEEDAYGYAQRALINSNGVQNNGIGVQNAVVPANGENYLPLSAPRGAKEFLHGQPYNAAVTDSGAADCETGQFGYMEGRLATASVDGVKASPPSRFNVVVAPHTPGAQGPTYAGRARVPRGETFQREPDHGVIR